MYRYFLAIRYLLSRPINLLGVIGILLGVWALIVVVSIFSGYLKEVQKHLQSSTADMTAVRIPGNASYAELSRRILSDPNVVACSPRFVWPALLHPSGSKQEIGSRGLGITEPGADTPLALVVGIDPRLERDVTGFAGWLAGVSDPKLRVPDLENPLAPRDGQPSLLLSRQRLVREGVAVGDRATLTTAQLLREGAKDDLELEDLKLAINGVYDTSYAGYDSLHVFVHIDTLRALLEDRGGVDFVNEIAIRVRDPDSAAATAERLTRKLAAGSPFSGISVRTWARANANQLSSIDHQRALMKLVLFVIIVVAAFLMFATLSMMVTEKTRDIGILTAMGASPRGVMTVFMVCGTAIAVAGTSAGVVCGWLSSIYLDDFNRLMRNWFDIDLFPMRIYNLKFVPYDLDPLWILQVCAMAMGLGILVSGIPAWLAARHDPVKSLRNE